MVEELNQLWTKPTDQRLYRRKGTSVHVCSCPVARQPEKTPRSSWEVPRQQEGHNIPQGRDTAEGARHCKAEESKRGTTALTELPGQEFLALLGPCSSHSSGFTCLNLQEWVELYVSSHAHARGINCCIPHIWDKSSAILWMGWLEAKERYTTSNTQLQQEGNQLG